MSTIEQLRDALAHEQQSDPPNLDAIMRGGSRIRRRRQFGVGAACLTLGVATVGVSVTLVNEDLIGGDAGTIVLAGADLEDRARAGERLDARVQQLLDPVAPVVATSVSGFSWKNDDADDGTVEPLEPSDLPYVLHWQLEYDVTSAPGESVWVLAEWHEWKVTDPGNMGLCMGKGPDSPTPICGHETLRDGSYLLSIEGDVNGNGTWERRVVHTRLDGSWVLVADSVPAEAGSTFSYTFDELRSVATDPQVTFPEPVAFPD